MIAMLDDFVMIQHRFPDRHDIHIHFIADVHLGAREHLEHEWESFCAHLLDDPDAYLILGGDLINNTTRTSVANIFDETMRPKTQKQTMMRMLKPLRDRILCAVPGNHEGRSGRDADDCPIYDIMCKLDIEHLYRENIGFVKLQMGNQNGSGEKNPTYVLACMHGAGGGMLSGGVINRNERFAYTIDGIDALLIGHSHKPMISQPGKIFVDSRNNRAVIKPFKVVVATSWMDYGGYAAKKQLLPQSHAPQIITLKGNRKDIKITM